MMFNACIWNQQKNKMGLFWIELCCVVCVYVFSIMNAQNTTCTTTKRKLKPTLPMQLPFVGSIQPFIYFFCLSWNCVHFFAFSHLFFVQTYNFFYLLIKREKKKKSDIGWHSIISKNYIEYFYCTFFLLVLHSHL